MSMNTQNELPSRGRRAMLSLACTAMAWLLTYSLTALVFRLAVGWRGSASGTAAFLAVTGIACAAAYCAAFLPLVLLLRPGSPVFDVFVFGPLGAVAGLLTFLGYFVYVGGRELASPRTLLAYWPFAVYAATVGAIAAASYSLMLRRTLAMARADWLREPDPSLRPTT